MLRAHPQRRSRPSPARRPVASADCLEPRTLLTVFIVTTTDDSGPGSLREAIELANLSPVADVVQFNIPGPDLWHTISPASPLPEILSPLTVDARSQPGYVNAPVVELDGADAGPSANGLTVSAPNCTVRGLAINRFSGHGVAISAPRPAGPTTAATQGGINAKLESNYIGTDVTGNVDLGNGGAGVMVAATGVALGNPNATSAVPSRNVVSGNGFAGVWVVGASPGGIGTFNMFSNLVGTNASGSRALGNDREGLLIEGTVNTASIGSTLGIGGTQGLRNVISGNAASGIRVATTTTGTVTIRGSLIGTSLSGSAALGNGRSPLLPYRDGITFAGASLVLGGSGASGRNVISANGGSGVAIYSGNSVQVSGNFIGTDVTGNADLGNRLDGVVMTGGISGQVAGNVVSGNGGSGIHVTQNTRDVRVSGNFVGTDAAGTSALGNDGDGVRLETPTAVTIVGGSSPPVLEGAVGANSGNLISGNGGHGISVSGASLADAKQIFGNFIGTDVNAAAALGNAGSGIYLSGTTAVIGGPSTFNRNVISANGGDGITIVGAASLPPPQPSGSRIEGNLIGLGLVNKQTVDIFTDTGLGNRGNGIAIYYSANNRVGSMTGTTSGNKIAFNGLTGVLVQGATVTTPNSTSAAAEGNLLTGNAIFGNGRLGIDLAAAGEGVTPNDPLDADVGPNRLQNYPVITDAAYSSNNSTGAVRFTLHSEPNKTYRVEVFASLAPDPSGRGEGQLYVGFTTVTTDAGGNASGTWSGPVSFPFPTRPVNPVAFFTATATESGRNNTSEFSPAVRGNPTLTQPGPTPAGAATVVGRHVFYNNSAADLAGGDDAAIATDKSALLPGEAPSFASITSYYRGLNGVMVDVAGLPQSVVLTPDEFVARVADSTGGGEFRDAPAPSSVTVRRGAGVNGSDRVTLYWADNLPGAGGASAAVLNGWLEVKVLASAVTGLAAPDTFYFGNLVGETGNPRGGEAGAFAVDMNDVVRTRAAAASGEDATTLLSRFDHNRDGVVNASDVAIVRAYYGRRLEPFAAGPVITAAAATPVRYRPAAGRLAEQVLA